MSHQLNLMRFAFVGSLLLLAAVFFSSCSGDDDGGDSPNPSSEYTVPATYSFSNVDYTGQTQRIEMLKELTNEMKRGNTQGTALDAAILKNMYTNTDNPFSDAALNSAGKQLRDKTFPNDQAKFDAYLDSLAAASQSTVPGGNGIAGVVTSNDGTKNYLFNANGLEYVQIVEKGLGGACFFYQIANVYTSNDRIGTTLAKEDRQHHWDEAFGYFGAPIDYPANTSALNLLAKYSNDREALLQTGSAIMNAYLRGRAAIDNDDQPALDKAVDDLRLNYQLALGGTGIHYFNDAVSGFADDAIRNHVLSEAIAFTRALRYVPSEDALLTPAQIDEVLVDINETANLYELTQAQITSARDKLASFLGISDDIKTQL